MALAAGEKLGPYEILAPIGKGGMGEVYRARDTKLKREVAIKVLPEAFTADPGRMMRFQREAQVLASLDHPNIGAIYGLVEANGTPSLVLALVEGPTLDERIAAGPLPIEEAIPIAQQIIAALEYAHERGIIHRDLKPANVKITPEGSVKVLDFGLAKVLDEDHVAATGADSPTLTLGHTRAGVILGTAAYMSPEQAVGKTADRRSDIFSFGAVLYEMLTGVRAFTGDSAPEILAAVVKDDPDWSKLPAMTPRAVRELLRRCLTKDRKQRLQAIGEARIVLENPTRDEPAGAVIAAEPKRSWLWPAVAALFILTSAALGVVAWKYFHPAPPHLVKFSFPPPGKASFPTPMAVSPDGRRVAFEIWEGGKRELWLRDLDDPAPRMLAELPSTAPELPFWAPDSRRLGFFDGTKLKKIDVAGGPAVTIVDTASNAPPQQRLLEPGRCDHLWHDIIAGVPGSRGRRFPNSGDGSRQEPRRSLALGALVPARWPPLLVRCLHRECREKQRLCGRSQLQDPQTGDRLRHAGNLCESGIPLVCARPDADGSAVQHE
jgi:serine/threonine protein kinase